MSGQEHHKKKKKSIWEWIEILIGKMVHSIGRAFLD